MSVTDAHEASRRCGLFRLPVVRAIVAQLIHAVSFCHNKGIVHGDLHLQNVIFHFPTCAGIDDLSQDAVYEKFGHLTIFPVERIDGNALESGVLAHAVWPTWFGCRSEEVTFEDCAILLADFGEGYLVDGPRSGVPH